MPSSYRKRSRLRYGDKNERIRNSQYHSQNLQRRLPRRRDRQSKDIENDHHTPVQQLLPEVLHYFVYRLRAWVLPTFDGSNHNRAQ